LKTPYRDWPKTTEEAEGSRKQNEDKNFKREIQRGKQEKTRQKERNEAASW
jgi:hypothetical protein